MAAERQVVTKIVDLGPVDAFLGFRENLRKHLPKVRMVRAVRKRARGGRPSPLPVCAKVSFDPSTETLDDAVDAVVQLVAEDIERAADGRKFLGAIECYDDDGKRIDSVDVEIDPEDIQVPATKESESVAILSAARTFADGLVKANVTLAQSLASIGVAFKDVISSVATSNAQEAAARYEYEWKMQESRERMDDVRVREEANVMRRKDLLNAGKEILIEYAPLAELLAQWAINKSPAIAPTPEEIDRFFPQNRYTDLRRDLHALLADEDDENRKTLVRGLIKTIKALGPNAFGEARSALSEPRDVQRFGEIMGWISRPVRVTPRES